MSARKPPRGWFTRANDFFYRDLWEMDLEELSRARALFLRLLRLLIGIWRQFVGDRCLIRSSALAYATVLSIVPLFAFGFSILKGFGIQRRLEPLILERVAPASHETVEKIIGYIDRTNVGTLGAIALAGLVFSVVAILGNIEKSLNHIWGVKRGRTLPRKISDYLSVVVVGPLFLFAALSLTTSLQSHTLFTRLMEHTVFAHVRYFLILAGPYLCMWAALTFLYIFMPNTRVKFSSAVLGGIIAGSLWQIALWAYVHFQFGMAKYNAIYGTMAQMPILLVWIYISWVIVLLGAEVAAAHQHTGASWIGGAGIRFSSSLREALALLVMDRITTNFTHGGEPLVAADLARDLKSPPYLVNETIYQLCEAGFLAEVEDRKDVFLPLRDPSRVRASAVVDAIRSYGEVRKPPPHMTCSPALRDALARLSRAPECALGELRLGELSK